MTATNARRGSARWIVLGVFGILLLAMGFFLLWALWIPAPMAEALEAMENDELVRVTQGEVIAFAPVEDAKSCGIIFYPGGRVDPRAYAPPMRAIAEKGYQAVIVPMPLNLAILGIDRAAEVIAEHPEMTTWALAGHSLGGSAAAFFVHDNPDVAAGLALWAAYTTEGRSIADHAGLAVTSISASLDGLATPEKVDAARMWVPPTTRFVEIDGGNHAHFGWYGEQRGDNAATITREEQQAETVAATVEMMDAICDEK